jgi:methyl-accepting chemotaxis protein/methyl-accepting chemotaxis protein-1 (serine sensor receptor)
MKLDNLSLGTKVYVSQSVTAGLLLLLGVTSIASMISVESKLNTIASVDSKKMELCGSISTAVASGESSQRGMVLGSLTGNTAQVQSSQQKIQQASQTLQSAIREIEPLLYHPEGKRVFAELKSPVEEWARQIATFQAHINGQRFDEATRMQAEVFTPLMDKMQKQAEALSRLQRSLMDESSASAATVVTLSRWFSIILCLISLAVAAGAFWIIRHANAGLRRIAGEIAEGSRQVASAAQQVSGSSQALAQGASEQAATLQETSASTEEINSMTQKNTENASNAAVETENADKLLKETDRKLTQMIGSMKEINTSSEKISKIIRVIDEIAFQTNILALNAAVEAARAGEAGMGFAVVADEVRNLAQRCAQAAKDTSDLIEESIVRSNEGKTRLDEVAVCVSRVFENASQIRLLSNEVHVGSQEQARGIEQIARAVAQMQQVTQSTAASAEEGASAGEEMSAQAQTLRDAVEQLRAVVGRDGSSEAAYAKPRARAVSAAPARATRLSTMASAARPQTARQPQIPMEGDFQDF